MKNVAIPVGGSASLRRLAALIKSKILRHPVDRLATIRAQMSALRDQEKLIEDELKAKGEGAYEGVLFRAVVVDAERESTDWKAIASKFDVSHQLFTSHTKHLQYRVLRLNAKLKGSS